MRRLAAVAIAAGALPLALAAHPEGPPPAHTGGFGEPTCAACHAGEPERRDTTALRIDGLPGAYEPNRTYRLRVRLLHDGLARAGFQLAARFAEDGKQAGTLASADKRAAVLEHAGVQYAQHTLAGSAAAGNSASWTVEWTAPACGRAVTINVAANAGDDDASPLGDVVYAYRTRIPSSMLSDSAIRPPRAADDTTELALRHVRPMIRNGGIERTAAGY